MRRTDRQITDPQKIREIIRACDCCRVAFATDGAPYIVPLSFGFAQENGQLVFYFHSAKEGRKIDLVKTSPAVGFELDTNHCLNPGDTACGYSYHFQSVIGTGVLTPVAGEAEKRAGLLRIMAQMSGRDDWEFTPQALATVAILKLTVTELACKERK